MNRSLKAIAFAAAAAFSLPAAAQVSMAEQQGGPRDSRVQIGVVIPLGSAGSDSQRAPRVEIWSDHRPAGAGAAPAPLNPAAEPQIRPVRMGVTLQRQPQLMLNGQQMPQQGQRKDMSTAGWVAVGVVGTVAVVFGLAMAGTFGQIVST